MKEEGPGPLGGGAVVPKNEHYYYYYYYYYYYPVAVPKLLQNLTAETILCITLLQEKLKANIIENKRTANKTNGNNKQKARKYKLICRLFTLNY